MNLSNVTWFSKLPSLVLIIFLSACGGDESAKENKPAKEIHFNKLLSINDQNIEDYKKSYREIPPSEKDEESASLLVIADDRSGSNVNRKLNIEDYNKIINSFSEHHSGTVAVRVIGNPANDNLEFHRMTISPFLLGLPECKKYNSLNLSKDLTLSELGIYNINREKLFIENEKIVAENKNKIENFNTTIDEHIINYKKAGRDITDINDALKHLSEIINERTFRDLTKIYVIILSDGVHDATKQKVKSFETELPIELHLVGWEDKSVFSSISNVNVYESKEGFLNSTNKIFN